MFESTEVYYKCTECGNPLIWGFQIWFPWCTDPECEECGATSWTTDVIRL